MDNVVIDFVGMCVFIKDGNALRVGLLNENKHLHMITFQKDGLPVIKGVHPGAYRIPECARGATTLVPMDMLPSLGEFGGGPKAPADVVAAMRVFLDLPAGALVAQEPVKPAATGPWLFATANGARSHNLTDRSRFTGSTEDPNAMFITIESKETEIRIPRGPDGVFRATLGAIDHDAGNRQVELEPGFKLIEFSLLYRCTNRVGPIPVFQGNTSGRLSGLDSEPSNPDEPICPQGVLP